MVIKLARFTVQLKSINHINVTTTIFNNNHKNTVFHLPFKQEKSLLKLIRVMSTNPLGSLVNLQQQCCRQSGCYPIFRYFYPTNELSSIGIFIKDIYIKDIAFYVQKHFHHFIRIGLEDILTYYAMFSKNFIICLSIIINIS